MKMSSRRAGFEGGSITEHRPDYVHPPTGERDECLNVPLALGPLSVVESPGLRRAAQAGEGRLVEDPLEVLVTSSHPGVVGDPFSGVAGGGHEARVGGEMVGAFEGREVPYGEEELGPQ
jgi:hypothetical protein